MMYLVRRYVNELPQGAYGVDNSYYIVGLFDSEEKAKAAMKKAVGQARETDFDEQYECHITTIDIIPIEVNKAYKEDDQIYYGGGFYVE